MIKINLAKRKMAAAVSGELSSGRGMTANLKLSEISEWPIRSILIALAGIYGSEFYFNGEKATALSRMEEEVTALNGVQNKLRSELAKNTSYEDIKKSLEADERLVKVKLDTILKLMQDRQGGVQALKRISSSIPTEVWLSALQFSATDLQVSGQALDYAQVSDFMKRLGEGDFVSDLNLENSTQGKDEKGLSVASFRLSAKRK